MVKGDICVICMIIFVIGYSLRFFRVIGIRYDKKWFDILIFCDFLKMIEEEVLILKVNIDDIWGGMNVWKCLCMMGFVMLLFVYFMSVDVSGVV